MPDTQRTAQELADELKQARHEYGKALAGCDSKPIRLARALDLGKAIDAAIDRLAALASQAEPVAPNGFVLVSEKKLRAAAQQAKAAADCIVGFAKDNPGRMCGWLDDACAAADIAADGFAAVLSTPPAPAQAEQSEPGGVSIGVHALADELRKAIRDDEDYGAVNYPLRDGVFGPRVTAWLRKVAAEYLRGAVSAEQSEDGRDAARYRWLRDRVCMVQAASYGCKFQILNLPPHFGDCEPDPRPPFDAAIDAAIAAKEQP